MTEVHCDYVQATFAADDWAAVREAIEPALDVGGCHLELDEPGRVLWRAGDGTVKATRYGPVVAVGASGAVLASLRAVRAFAGYLAALGSVPHKVTRVDAALDVVEDTPDVLDRIRAAALSTRGISLTRKRVAPRHVTRFVTTREDGRDTGTCYVGSRDADVRAAVYDKRRERIDKGLPDVGPLTRYEVRVKCGATLRDAAEPAAMFWHFMAPGILPAPRGQERWISRGDGYQVDWPDKPLPAARLARRVEESPDVVALLRLSEEVGPRGFDFLVSLLRSRAASV